MCLSHTIKEKLRSGTSRGPKTGRTNVSQDPSIAEASRKSFVSNEPKFMLSRAPTIVNSTRHMLGVGPSLVSVLLSKK
uniref:Uncharacterized protein n=1 Tax=Globisporangium ultimum (strain ATCC 200006 / CBS 805.95 / DAOM BR144) TaxID=431595 RepID=K3WY42_GLOUD